jgi:hypothetical protein
VRQGVSASISNGVTYTIGKWLRTWSPGGLARVQLRVTSTVEGEQIFAGSEVSIDDTTWTSVQGTITPTWSGTLLSAYWEGVSDIAEVFRDDTYMRVQDGSGQRINIRLQVGSEASALVQSGVALLNSPL